MDRYYVPVPNGQQREKARWWLENLVVYRARSAQEVASMHASTYCDLHEVLGCTTAEEAVALAHSMRDAVANDLELRAKEMRAIQCVVSGK